MPRTVHGVLVVGIGAMRAGSTTLHNFLAAHRDVVVTNRKEVHYFDRNYALGPAWFDSQFPASKAPWRADITPLYMYTPDAAPRIARAADAVVVVLRDPVTRAYSHYLQKRSYGTEPLTFSDALDAEPDRLRRSEQERARYSYADRGLYLDQLLPYERALGRDAMHAIIVDDLRSSPGIAWQALCSFLDIGVPRDVQTQPSNPYVEFRSLRIRSATHRLPPPAKRIVGRLNSRRVAPPPLDPCVRDRLRRFFGPSVDALSDWLGRDLRSLWWSSSAS